jgi:hypothetical protein
MFFPNLQVEKEQVHWLISTQLLKFYYKREKLLFKLFDYYWLKEFTSIWYHIEVLFDLLIEQNDQPALRWLYLIYLSICLSVYHLSLFLSIHPSSIYPPII